MEKQTEGKLKNVVGRAVVGLKSSLVLLSVAHLEGIWTLSFVDVKKSNFTIENGTSVKVPFIESQNALVRYCLSPSLTKRLIGKRLKMNNVRPYTMLELGMFGSLAMIIILPDESANIKDIVEHLTIAELTKNISDLMSVKKRRAHVRLPKISLEEEHDLCDIFDELGVKKLFSIDANLKGISAQRPGFVSTAVHTAVITLDENRLTNEAERPKQLQTVEKGSALDSIADLQLDRPFVFFVRDHCTKAILFTGVIKIF
jgi:serine protease inhibitor